MPIRFPNSAYILIFKKRKTWNLVHTSSCSGLWKNLAVKMVTKLHAVLYMNQVQHTHTICYPTNTQVERKSLTRILQLKFSRFYYRG